MLPQRFQLDNLLVNLGWYSENELSDRATKLISQLKPFITKLENITKSGGPQQSPMIMMQLSQKSSELLI